MAEYSPISIYLKNKMFSPTIIISTIIITFPVLISALYCFTSMLIKSEPPVDEFAFKIIAVPKPIIIPP